MIKLKRAYDDATRSSDDLRFLVERLWPRGVKNTNLPIDAWLRAVAPSTKLRKWFGHNAAKWEGSREYYFQELDSNPDAWGDLLEAAHRGVGTLIFSSHDTDHNNAVALRS